MIKFKFVFWFFLFSLNIFSSECGKHRKISNHESSYKNDRTLSTIFSGNSSEINLFSKVDSSAYATKTDGLWRWRLKSNALRVHDDIMHHLLQEIRHSFSLEFRVKMKRENKVSLLRIITDADDHITWLDIILDYQKSKLEVFFISDSMIPERTVFDLIGPYNTWMTFLITFKQSDSTITLISIRLPKQIHSVADGISLDFPVNSQILIGGRSSNAPNSFLGFVSRAIMYIPATDVLPLSKDINLATTQSKRRAARKPFFAGDISALSDAPVVSRTVDDSFDLRGSVQLRDEIRKCRNDLGQVNDMLIMLKQSHKDLQDRVAYLEACECRLPPCITEGGRSFNHNDSWTEDDCIQCRCHLGIIHCQTNLSCSVNPCDGITCRNGGTCRVNGGSFQCSCRHGYIGRYCDQIDHCSRGTCRNGGRCEMLPGNGYRCFCLDGYTGNNCEIRDWCYLSPCFHGATCLNRQSSYDCICPSGFSGERCERRNWCIGNPCLNGGECQNMNEEYRCICQIGYVGNNCQYSDLCENNPCGDKGTCLSIIEDDGVNYDCECVDGYTGKNCGQVDVCASSPCLNGGFCRIVGQVFECRCRLGFTGDQCEIADSCFTEPCMNGALCRNTISGFECACMAGFYGTLCEHRDICSSDSCANGGTCIPDNGRFLCTCRRQYFGDRCQYTDYCRARPCRNNAVCRNVPYNSEQPYTCECKIGFTGPMCELVDVCTSNPCLNNGVCDVQGRSYICTCVAAFHGERCEWVDYCSRNPCLNGGECSNEDHGFVCTCPLSHIGQRCENPHPCRLNPCLNGGECVSTPSGGYTCRCPASHYGVLCNQINHCFRNPCLNGGKCLNNETGFTCTCTNGYVGSDCSIEDGCQTNPCLNNGVCRNVNGDFFCECPPTHQGSRCQYQCNICLYLPDKGTSCDGGIEDSSSFERRWYYDKFTQSCRSLQYSGCGGNSNNFQTRQECRQRCILGSCCVMYLSASPTLTCKYKSLGQCKRLNIERSDIQVVSFKPGERCSRESCNIPSTCTFGHSQTPVGSEMDIGCNYRCSCLDGGVLDCPCTRTSIRKEIRRLTFEEIREFHGAVRALKEKDRRTGISSWDAMRDEYMRRAPIIQSHLYFLLWNRAFLKKMELLLQRVNCRVTIPYYDFTMDAGLFNESVIWQPTYFGGDGFCVPDHQFRPIERGRAIQWQPCLVRQFNYTVSIPNMVDIALALSATSLEDLGANLLGIVSYLKAFIGGDMATAACPYDPLFYSTYAFIDYLFSQWQRKHPEVLLPAYSDSVFLGMPASSVWSGSCVTYVSMGHSEPCNVSNASPHRFGEDGYNLQGFSREGFNRQGYDRNGYDVRGRDRFGRPDPRQLYIYDGYNAQGYNRSGYDRRGFNYYGFCKGFNRDGYNAAGFDRNGYNRYGLDTDGYDARGYNLYGVSRDGSRDTSEYYDSDTGYSDSCFSRDGLTVSGLDKYGFSASGHDFYNCDYFFQGPFSLYYQYKLWRSLSIQPRTFLMTLSRTCGPLLEQSTTLLEQDWLSRDSRLPVLSTTSVGTSHFSKKFCLDTEMLLSWCPCLEGNYPAVCHINPCLGATCSLHPSARCRINMCGSTCTAEFFVNGRRVKCEDPCRSNPCAHGGTCIASKYSSASERFRCECPSGFSGSLCERQSVDTCILPKETGSCTGRQRRWFYNHMSRTCEEFIYSGCGGNVNNFPRLRACQLRCSVGACCYRIIANTSLLIGFDRDGYDKYGFNMYGLNRKGFHRSPLNSLPYGTRVLAPKGFGHDGYNFYGFNESGFDRQGYDKEGYHKVTGYNRTGYDRYGRFDGLHGYDINGLNSSGFFRDGFKCNGLSSSGYNYFGYYKEYDYNCQSLSQTECDSMSSTHEIISFAIGRSCEEVQCGDRCGCDFMGKLYRYGEQFQHGCRSCSCSLAGTVQCLCQQLRSRKEIRDLTEGERAIYTSAIRNLYESNNWEYFVNSHFEYLPQAYDVYSSLPWHRFFLSSLEGELQKIAGCKLTIPYFDWTIDVGSLDESYVWSASYFGGNGENNTNCVNYHPFQTRGRWSPCIRRNFNTSISLPDAVDIRLLLKETNFQNFSIQLQAVSALFHLWVGGHMASPFSAYDPLYVSHWAFIDHLWDEWQKNNLHGMPRFPLEHRYTQLKPFDVTPDDVLASQQQLCINYKPPTLGAPCNQTMETRPLERNEDGFDRHGYDMEGFDIEGFDVNGQNRRGESDNRNLYDQNGFTLNGYHRSGYDSQGWDRYGYNRMNRNRDGIDIGGYDAFGYDKYGFDRNGTTPFGMFRNGSFADGIDQGYAASLFDSFGYNRFGFSPDGLNRKGYSAYGFNTRGYDKDNCNYYNNGPHYMRLFFYGLSDLRKLPIESLKRINRICKPISPLPQTIAQRWLNNADLIRDFERRWASNRVINPNYLGRISSVTSDRLWLPLTPDKQFCFDLKMFSGCPVDTPLVDCPSNMCQISRCASHPRAACRMKNCGSCYLEFFDGNTGEIFTCFGCIDASGSIHGEGSDWEESCQVCVCQGGTITCAPPMCPPSRCSHPASAVGQCCPSCDACEYDGATYREGESFKNSRCEACRCIRGSITCRENQSPCVRVNCPNPITRAGECCPSCPIGCEGHREGEQWRMGPCHSCRCLSGAMQCYENRCPSTPCSHPYKASNSCCAQCNDCFYQGRLVENRKEFMDGPCKHCTCSSGTVVCRHRQCPSLTCNNQVTPQNQCCPICVSGCQFEGHSYLEGERFRSTISPCRNCTCQSGQVVCRGRQCRSVSSCPRPVVGSGGSCCSECSDCSYGDRTYRNHQMWTSEDGCERCSCERGNIACEMMYSCEQICTHGVRIPGRCCKDCSRCYHESKMFENGETFTHEKDPCQTCQCSDGNITCSSMSCPTLQCTSQMIKPGACCPSCRSCRQGSVNRDHGSTWRMERDACTTCTCQEGKINCQTERCPSVNCQYPVSTSNQCCRSCDGCFYNGEHYNTNDVIRSSDPCTNCTCIEGNVLCERRGCPRLDCHVQVTDAGQCCPRCASCSYEKQIFNEGETFQSPRNPCLRCVCEAGEVTCERLDMSCPDLDCPNPGREHGVCCPLCNNCVYERRNYRNGESFNPPGSSPCFTCTCANGTVECETQPCNGISCSNPVINPGQCCPSCEVCDMNGVTYQPGDQWSPDMCTTCSCEAGRTVCQVVTCPIPECSHPAQIGGSCCEICDACSISGHVFSHGQTFQHPTENCQICRCSRGNVDCQSFHCEPVACDLPVTQPGACCLSCPGQCHLDDDTTLESGMTVNNPDNDCEICSCSGGKLVCESKCNRDPPCRHPVQGKCCKDVCDGCYYRGKAYRNGQEFKRNKCRSCTCTNGNVRCIRQRCPALSCENPQIVESACCPVCPEARRDCDFGEQSILDGEHLQQGCQICRCDDGTIRCQPKPCPPAPCSHPTRKDCCRNCTDCQIDGIEYLDGENVPSSDGKCTSCRCTSGSLICTPKICPPVSCHHPTFDGCCTTCRDCLYDGHLQANGQKFNSADNPCEVCTCTNGNVVCEVRSCLPSNCTHPISTSESCCPVCGSDCLYDGSVQPNGLIFQKPGDSCKKCTCTSGSVLCHNKLCPRITCRNPAPGDCGCSICDDCSYNGVIKQNHQTFPNPQDGRCSECHCLDGNVSCGRRRCPSSPCTHPATDLCDCPLCDGCTYHGRLYANGHEFVDVEDTCNDCVCEEGNIVCDSRVCPSASCANPTMDQCGCPVCHSCHYLGVEYENPAEFIDTMNKCNQCTCRFGTVQCIHRPCPSIYCSNPVTPFGECCPKCIGGCLVEGNQYQDGSTFKLPSDICSSCTCQSGEVQCLDTRCDRSCTHPISDNRCCPVCTGCLYQGQMFEEGESFTARNDPCRKCSCIQGNVICQELRCPILDCINPRTVRGRCCRECPESLEGGCNVDGKVREAGARWVRRRGTSCSECSCSSDEELTCVEPVCEDDCSHPVPNLDRCCSSCSSCYYENRTYASGEMFQPNSCLDCICRHGNVQCAARVCQPLSCPLHQQFQSRNDCCPMCISCVMGEHMFADDETWISAADECVTCQCRHGVITCQPIMCLPACQLMSNIPGVCCPACKGCRHGSEIYHIGDRFEPNPMNPCEICQCIAGSDGLPFHYCHQVACPSLADCPRGCIRQPHPGTCCPTCADSRTCDYGLCNVETRGSQLHPVDNPCFSCECNTNDTWECGPINCPALDCPQEEKYTLKGSCCPICDSCHLLSDNSQVANGFTWRVSDCQTCHCDHGSIVCMEQECALPVICTPPMVQYRENGDCCERCVDPHATCLYEGATIPSGNRWLVDKCTTCQCYAGKITCATQRCRMVMCDSDEVASVIPGECCPRCLPKSATCIAFGESHYRTFDGRMINFQGQCRYLFTSDCMDGDFRVDVENTRLDNSNGDVSWTDKVYLTVSSHRVTLTSDYHVFLNGTSVELPLLIKPRLFLDKTDSHILVNTDVGVQLIWNGKQHHLEVNVPGSYKQRTCGLCGNFNNFPQDDMRLRNSRITTNDAIFGNNWKVTQSNASPCPDISTFDPCDGLSYGQRNKANNACKILRSSVFSACHQVVNPEMYFAACVYDVCACGENKKFCLCDVLEAYASQCRRSGVVLNWRSSTLCDIKCQTERGYVFDECGSPCKRTCANKNLPPEEIDRQCFMPCISGCQCVAGKLEHEGRCITPSLCPDHITSVDVSELN